MLAWRDGPEVGELNDQGREAEERPAGHGPALGDGDLEEVSTVAVEALLDKLGTEVVVLAVGPVLAVAEQFVVASGSNPRQVRALVEEVEARVKQRLGRAPLRVEGADEHRWVLLDYGEVVVHVFDEDVRRFYDLERLWADVAAWRPTEAPRPAR